MIVIILTTIDRFVWTLCMCTSAPILITDDREVCVNVYIHYCHHTLSSLLTMIISIIHCQQHYHHRPHTYIRYIHTTIHYCSTLSLSYIGIIAIIIAIIHHHNYNCYTFRGQTKSKAIKNGYAVDSIDNDLLSIGNCESDMISIPRSAIKRYDL